jgi:uncharacterized protein YjbI with pentapeptide repeats
MLHRSNKTAGAKRGLIETSAYDALLPYVAGPDEPPRYALHFGTVEKIGVNPRSQYSTPLAVCAYPLTEEIFQQFIEIDLPFAQEDANYLYLLKIEPGARVFYSTPDFFERGVGPNYLDDDLSNIDIDPFEDKLSPEALEREPFSKRLFYSTRPLGYYNRKKFFTDFTRDRDDDRGTASRAAQWGRRLVKMGIDVWVDADNEGILHENEPSQVMFFNPRSYSIVLSMDNPKTKMEIRYGRDWRRRARDLNLSGVNFHGEKLRGIDLSDTKIYRSKFHRADLSNADLRGAEFHSCIFSSANLSGARVQGADFHSCDMRSVYLKDVKDDQRTKWPDSVLDILRAWKGEKNLAGVNFRDNNMMRIDLRGADLRGAKCHGDMRFANLEGADLRGADFHSADMAYVRLKGVIIDGKTDLRDEAHNAILALSGERNLSSIVLIQMYLAGADLSGAQMEVATLSQADLTGAKLIGANLRMAELQGAYLTGAYLTGADLREARLQGADLTRADLRDADLTGAVYDAETKWPSGFEPPETAEFYDKILSNVFAAHGPPYDGFPEGE